MKFFIKIVLPAILITTCSLKSMEKASSKVDYSYDKTMIDTEEEAVYAVALSQDGKKALIGLEDATVYLLDIGTGKKLHNLVGHTDPIFAATLSNDNKTALTAGYDKKVIVWALKEGKPKAKIVREIQYNEEITSIALNNNTNTAFIGFPNQQIYLLDLEKGIRSLTKYKGDIVAVSQDGKTIMTGVRTSMINGKIFLWSLNENLLKTFTTGTVIVSGALSPDATQVLIGSENGTARLWDLTKENQFQDLKEPGDNSTNSVAFSSNGEFIALCSSGKNITLLKCKTATPLAEAQIKTFNTKDIIQSVALSPDGTQALIRSTTEAVNLWDFTKEENQFQDPGSSCAINSVAFSGNGDLIALGSENKDITLLKHKTATPLAQHPQVEAEAANSDDTIEPKGECSVQ